MVAQTKGVTGSGDGEEGSDSRYMLKVEPV